MAHQYDAPSGGKAAGDGDKPTLPTPHRAMSPAEVAVLDQIPDDVRATLTPDELSERVRNVAQLQSMCQGLSPNDAGGYQSLIASELLRPGIKGKKAKRKAQRAERVKMAASLRHRLEVGGSSMPPTEARALWTLVDDLER
jgi:hypothetical protein